ncbi:MAG TPA: hypothetical protein VFG21_09610 [Xanthomonadaceae bacterium]|nr:hypothetical protein [Xanthomonadaceae bacterium]
MTHAHPESRHPLAPLLRHWLLLGATAVLLLPAARGDSLLLGWLPFWLVLAPAAMLAVAERSRLAAALRILLVRPQRRRRASLTLLVSP